MVDRSSGNERGFLHETCVVRGVGGEGGVSE